MQAAVIHILALTTIVRERLMPIPGRVVVRLAQKVAAIDVIAEAEFTREHVLLDVAGILGISSAAAELLVRCKPGEQLTKNTVVAQGDGIFPKTIRVPRPGRVVAVGGGQVLLAVDESSFELHAGLPGLVNQIIPDRGAVIQAFGALIQGVWGNGHIGAGLMLCLAENPGYVLAPNHLDVSMRGSVILAGPCRDAKVLHALAELPARGLILSSISPDLIPLALQMRYPIMVTDGFGQQPMNSSAFKILSTNNKRDVALNAEPYERYGSIRPEVVIPLPVSQEPPISHAMETLAPGQQVRLRLDPHACQISTLVGLIPGLTTLPNGLRLPAAEVRLENGEQLIVPLVNLEVVG
ncbi:MAG: hypothetical protein MUP03_03625 [Anaerolineales bacterium]|nr:hypothetical protein [Anaerolineales bacterium]